LRSLRRRLRRPVPVGLVLDAGGDGADAADGESRRSEFGHACAEDGLCPAEERGQVEAVSPRLIAPVAQLASEPAASAEEQRLHRRLAQPEFAGNFGVGQTPPLTQQ
jgi:hypothetical protein